MFVTKPPLFSISLCSLLGSWLNESCLATPFLLITAHESPTFATTNFLPFISIAVTAVEPPLSKSTDLSNIMLSVVWYAFLIAFSVSVQKSGYNLARGTTSFFHQREKEMCDKDEGNQSYLIYYVIEKMRLKIICNIMTQMPIKYCK